LLVISTRESLWKTSRKLSGIFRGRLMHMELTLEELKERLAMLDEITLMELLDIHSDELVEAFEDRIEDNLEKLIKEVQ
jgi:hypothetical protein